MIGTGFGLILTKVYEMIYTGNKPLVVEQS